jgi:hypothetical protein
VLGRDLDDPEGLDVVAGEDRRGTVVGGEEALRGDAAAGR